MVMELEAPGARAAPSGGRERILQVARAAFVERGFSAVSMQEIADAAALTKALGEAGIPAYSDTDAGFFSLPEVRDAVNLLRVLDNPWDDEPLLAVLASPVCGFSPRELISISEVSGCTET